MRRALSYCSRSCVVKSPLIRRFISERKRITSSFVIEGLGMEGIIFKVLFRRKFSNFLFNKQINAHACKYASSQLLCLARRWDDIVVNMKHSECGVVNLVKPSLGEMISCLRHSVYRGCGYPTLRYASCGVYHESAHLRCDNLYKFPCSRQRSSRARTLRVWFKYV